MPRPNQIHYPDKTNDQDKAQSNTETRSKVRPLLIISATEEPSQIKAKKTGTMAKIRRKQRP